VEKKRPTLTVGDGQTSGPLAQASRKFFKRGELRGEGGGGEKSKGDKPYPREKCKQRGGGKSAGKKKRKQSNRNNDQGGGGERE